MAICPLSAEEKEYLSGPLEDLFEKLRKGNGNNAKKWNEVLGECYNTLKSDAAKQAAKKKVEVGALKLFTWSNKGELAASFFAVCKFAKNLGIALSHSQNNVLSALCAAFIKTSPVPPHLITTKRIRTKISDFLAGGAYQGTIVPTASTATTQKATPPPPKRKRVSTAPAASPPGKKIKKAEQHTQKKEKDEDNEDCTTPTQPTDICNTPPHQCIKKIPEKLSPIAAVEEEQPSTPKTKATMEEEQHPSTPKTEATASPCDILTTPPSCSWSNPRRKNAARPRPAGVSHDAETTAATQFFTGISQGMFSLEQDRFAGMELQDRLPLQVKYTKELLEAHFEGVVVTAKLAAALQMICWAVRMWLYIAARIVHGKTTEPQDDVEKLIPHIENLAELANRYLDHSLTAPHIEKVFKDDKGPQLIEALKHVSISRTLPQTVALLRAIEESEISQNTPLPSPSSFSSIIPTPQKSVALPTFPDLSIMEDHRA